VVGLRTFEQPFSGGWRFLIIILLVIGVFFRFANLDHKLYWHDEVYTSLRAAGFTSKEIGQEIFQNQILTPQDLQKFQRLKPGSTASYTIRSLAIEDPQHPPLYFLISRFWMQLFGSSITASRSLPALLSLLSLPLMYALGLELFFSPLAALLTTIFLALSPFDVLFSQIARQYSFLTVAIICSSFLLLKALRLPTLPNWGLYTLATVIGLYTHAFFGLTIIGHFFFIVFHFINKENRTEDAFKFFISITATIGIYSPWLIVLITNSQRALDTTSWSSGSVDVLLLVKLWILSFTALFLDLDFGFDSIWTYLLRLPIILLIAVAIYTVCRRTNRTTWLFILTSIFVPFLMLALPDLLSGGRRSAVSRYLISCYPGVQLAVAYFLQNLILKGQKIWRVVLALLVTSSIASCTVSALADTWWSNVPSYSNAEVAREINANPAPLLISDVGNDGTNLGDLISLSYLLNQDVRLLLLSQIPDLKLLANKSNAFVFRPSESLSKALQQQKRRLKNVLPSRQLWQMQNY
jgi:uncharacterized membrane protein